MAAGGMRQRAQFVGRAYLESRPWRGRAGIVGAMNTPAPLTQWLLWAWLSGLTLLAASLAESGQLSQHWLAPLVLGFAWLKGWAVIEHYMGLRHAPRWLRAGVHGWLLLVTGVLLLSFR